MKTNQLRAATGISLRRLNYWIAKGVIPMPPSVGSGHARNFTEDQAKRIKVLVEISNGLNCYISLAILKEVYRSYEQGFIIIGDGITLSWDD